MTSSPEFSAFPLNQVPQAWDNSMHFLSALMSGTVYIDRLYYLFPLEKIEKSEIIPDFGHGKQTVPTVSIFIQLFLHPVDVR